MAPDKKLVLSTECAYTPGPKQRHFGCIIVNTSNDWFILDFNKVLNHYVFFFHCLLIKRSSLVVSLHGNMKRGRRQNIVQTKYKYWADADLDIALIRLSALVMTLSNQSTPHLRPWHQ